MRKTYQQLKEEAWQRAIDWQYEVATLGNISYWELYLEQVRLARLGARYGLLKEFRENGIC